MNAVCSKSFLALIFALIFFSVLNKVVLAGVNPDLQARIDSLPLPENIEGKPARFGSVRKLLEISSGARQVLESDNPEAHQAYIEARKSYLDAAADPDNTRVNELLNKTVKLMYQAIRAASPRKLQDQKKLRDYKRKLLSVNALLEALERISIEKHNEDDTNRLRAKINQIVESSDKQVKNGDIDTAREQLDEAYLLVKTGIDNMRSGDVLVRELKFASKEEEYSYELDRNDTHQMLVNLLLEKKLAGKPEAYKKSIKDRVDKALEIRATAESMGKSGDFEEAIAELEKSTKELVRAIRMGGIFIPG
ncbi:MAG: hypothetical protein EP300_04615 [Gammaproteobacteria bacterium]|nr:MAG: hypothetical protein EP300_04615 [Gammaproteobacteria bacterium]